MNRLNAFLNVTLDGYFCGPDGDMSWAHSGADDPEWQAYVDGNAKGGGALVFGRVTYEMMASYWPTPIAAQNAPVVAERMNQMRKIVFSRTLDRVSWNNTTLLKGDLIQEARKLKTEPGDDMTILGSGSIVAQLAAARLIDEFQLVVNPFVLGKGRTPFDGLPQAQPLKLASSRAFGNGKVVLCYQPA
jgi:dihydrofolate reductase